MSGEEVEEVEQYVDNNVLDDDINNHVDDDVIMANPFNFDYDLNDIDIELGE